MGSDPIIHFVFLVKLRRNHLHGCPVHGRCIQLL